MMMTVRGNEFCIRRAKIYIHSLFSADVLVLGLVLVLVLVLGLVLVLVLGQTSLCAAVSNCQHGWLRSNKLTNDFLVKV